MIISDYILLHIHITIYFKSIVLNKPKLNLQTYNLKTIRDYFTWRRRLNSKISLNNSCPTSTALKEPSDIRKFKSVLYKTNVTCNIKISNLMWTFLCSEKSNCTDLVNSN